MAEFYSARDWEIPPLPWTNLSPPFSHEAGYKNLLSHCYIILQLSSGRSRHLLATSVKVILAKLLDLRQPVNISSQIKVESPPALASESRTIARQCAYSGVLHISTNWCR